MTLLTKNLKKEKRKKGKMTITARSENYTIPLLQNGFVLLLPLVLKVGGELVPDAEDSVG